MAHLGEELRLGPVGAVGFFRGFNREVLFALIEDHREEYKSLKDQEHPQHRQDNLKRPIECIGVDHV